MGNSGVVFRWLPSNQNEIRNHRKNCGRTPNLQSHIDKMHLNYIATRPGAVFNSKYHGIFGYIYDNEKNILQDCDNLELKIISDRVGEMSKNGIDVFKTVISLTEDDAISYGYTDRNSWKGLIELKINKIAYEFKIPIRDFEWTASYHTERGHLHCHLLFWDRNQYSDEKRNNQMPFVRFKEIRKELAKEIFKEEYLEKLEEKNLNQEKILGISEKEIENWLYEVMPNDMPVKKVFNNKIKNVEELTNLIGGLRDFVKSENLKNFGSKKMNYRYGFQSHNVKEYIDNISNLIIDSSVDFKKTCEGYINSCIAVQNTIGSIENSKDIEKIRENSLKEIYKRMGNILLKYIKEIDIENNRRIYQEKYNERKEKYEKDMAVRFENKLIANNEYINNFSTFNIVRRMFNEIERLNTSNYARLSRVKRNYSNLSREERNAIAKMKENSNGFEWFEE